MPVFRSRKNLEIARGIRAFFNLDAGLTRGVVPSVERIQSRLMQAQRRVEQLRKRLSNKERQLEQLRGRLSEKNRLVVALQTKLDASGVGTKDHILRDWFDSLIEQGKDPAGDDQPEFVRATVRSLRNEIRVAKIVEESAERFRALAGKKGLKVHLGCGRDIRPGWVNIDLAPKGDPAAHSDATFINYDLRLGLPLEYESCEYIYSSHFFEHLEYQQGLRLMRDCYRALQPGGTFRISLPDMKELFDAYVRGDDPDSYGSLVEFPDLLPGSEPGTETLIDHINYGVYQNGEHKYIYDEDTVISVLRETGYRSVDLSSYREGIDPSEPIRRRYSFYVEAVK